MTDNKDFANYKDKNLTKPRDEAWGNWAGFEKVGDKVQGYIRDAFFRPAEGVYMEQRGITLEQLDGKLINVGIKRKFDNKKTGKIELKTFVLNKTDDLHIGDPLTVELTELKKNSGLNDSKILSFFGEELPENAENKTVKELEEKDMKAGGSVDPEVEEEKEDTDEIDVF
jgi:hypothetical protein